MFSDKLSASLLKICETRRISYECAAELCEISPKHFSNVIRKTTCPSIGILEKMCDAFDKTPNELLGCSPSEQLSYRAPKMIADAYCLYLTEHLAIYFVCPQCGGLIEREHQNYCGHCGQCLSWEKRDRIQFTELF